jgi:ketosteroid isomerase-like protein
MRTATVQSQRGFANGLNRHYYFRAMKTRILLTLLWLLLLSTLSRAQTAPDAAELTRLLNEFLAGASVNDANVHDRFWADDLIYTRSAGVRTNKAAMMKNLRNATAPKPDDPKTVYTAEDIQIHQYGDAAVVAFRLVATTTKNGATEVANYLNTGTFVKRDKRWQAVAWQSTAVPRSAAKP